MFLFANFSIAQDLSNAFVREGKIFVQYNNGTSKQIVSEGENTLIGFVRNKNLVIYQRVVQMSKLRGEEQMPNDQISVRAFDLNLNKERTLFTTCLDGSGGTIPDYANSSIYPASNLCGFKTAILSKDGERLYFQTDSWATSPAIHYYNLKENALIFFNSGWLKSVSDEGVIVETTGVGDNGRYVNTCLLDKNGDLIKVLSEK